MKRVFASLLADVFFAVSTELVRELEIEPAAKIGRSVTITLPLLPTESGIVSISDGLADPPVAIGGICGLLRLGTPMFEIFTPTPQNQSSVFPIPNDSSLLGTTFYFQAIRTQGATSEFTRVQSLTIVG